VTDDKMLDKVRKLLAKAERAGTEQEAEAFTAKAQELILRYAIDEAMLQRKGEKQNEKIVARTVHVEGYAKAKLLLLRAVARGVGCDAAFYSNDRGGWSKGRAEVIGWESDMAAFDVLFASLQMQAKHEADREFAKVKRAYPHARRVYDNWLTAYNKMRHELWVQDNQRSLRGEPQLGWGEKRRLEAEWEDENPRPDNPGDKPPHGRAFMQSFLIGYAAEVQSRLMKQRQRTVADVDETTPGAALAVVDRDKAVAQFGNQRWTYGGSRGRGASTSSNAGYYSGRAAGQRANIGSTSVGGGRRAIGR
jgi:hypothetical protein